MNESVEVSEKGAIGLHAFAGGMTPPMNHLVLAQVLLPLPAGLPEEYGWRGFALPHLLRSAAPLPRA